MSDTYLTNTALKKRKTQKETVVHSNGLSPGIEINKTKPGHFRDGIELKIDTLHHLKVNALKIDPGNQYNSLYYTCILVLLKYIFNQLHLRENKIGLGRFPVKVLKRFGWEYIHELAVDMDSEIGECIDIQLCYINLSNNNILNVHNFHDIHNIHNIHNIHDYNNSHNPQGDFPVDFASLPKGNERIPVFIVALEQATGTIPCDSKLLEYVFYFLSAELEMKIDIDPRHSQLESASSVDDDKMRKNIEGMGDLIQRIKKYMR